MGDLVNLNRTRQRPRRVPPRAAQRAGEEELLRVFMDGWRIRAEAVRRNRAAAAGGTPPMFPCPRRRGLDLRFIWGLIATTIALRSRKR